MFGTETQQGEDSNLSQQIDETITAEQHAATCWFHKFLILLLYVNESHLSVFSVSVCFPRSVIPLSFIVMKQLDHHHR